MKIEIPFNGWSKVRLHRRKKTATSRTTKYGMIGDTFTVEGKEFEITLIMRLPLQNIANHYYDSEGADSPNEFIEVWKGIHPKFGWTPEKKVWIHFFEEVRK